MQELPGGRAPRHGWHVGVSVARESVDVRLRAAGAPYSRGLTAPAGILLVSAFLAVFVSAASRRRKAAESPGRARIPR